ncbi:hypothetical protein UFOVP1202_19 [uncultured Caudovirales phage]|uniref:Uncharacterized protein n=1 Tax=uncultured Caudovirales phage TaxID=2100421 RepID=A0A6J5R5M0_9CAUD|nr:hypothetical protein UFOVP1202_19 [uncultured Caudovirales phage]
MASVFDRPMFQRGGPHTVARDRLKKMGNIQDYASEGMFGTGRTMEDTGFRYQQPLGYGEGQVDPSILEATKQRALSGSQIVQGGRYTQKDVLGLVGQFQQARNDLLQQIKDVQLSSDPNKFEVIKDLEGKIISLDQIRDQTLEKAGKITYTAQDKYGQLADSPTALPVREDPMGPGEMDIFQNISERAAAENLKQKPPVFGGAPAQKPVVTAAEAQVQNQSGPSGMEMEARKFPNGPQVSQVPQEVQKGPTGMEAEVLGRKGTITPADVAAGLNDPKPEVREKTALDFAKQFSDMSPKYEGLDKGLMLAQIGFAIAAGESPNAMKNIADGLSAGAGMMIKEKQAKNEFDRQVQLSAMQYGLGEAGKLETEKRALAREGKNGSFFVADKDLTFGGRKYDQGDNVFVPNSQLWEGGLPAGLSTETSYNALLTTQATLQKAMLEAKARGVIDGDQYKMVMTGLNEAADSYGQATKMLPILEASLIKVADGSVTGIVPALKTAFNRAANAFGLKPEASYENKEQYVADLEKVTTQMVGDILGEGGKTISDNDRRIVSEIAATMNTVKDQLIPGSVQADPDVVIKKIQDLMTTLESNQRKAVDMYSTYMKDYGSSQTMSGAPFKSLYAERIFNTPSLSYTVGDDGIYRITTEGQ